MEDSIAFMLLLQAVLIGLNAIFACAEIAVLSVNDNKLARLAAQGDRRAVRLQRLTSQPARFLATIQVAITLSGFLGSAFAADNFSDKLVDALVALGVTIPVKTLDTIAVVLITIILSYFTLIFGELVPKRLAMRKAEILALGMSSLVNAMSRLFAPIVWLLTASTNGILRLMQIDPNAQDEAVSEEEIRMLVDEGSERGAIDREEKEFIHNVFEFDDLTAGEICTHRTEVDVLWREDAIETWSQSILSSRHALFPLCGETADDVVGVLSARAFFRLRDQSRESVMRDAVKPAYFVPESVKADVLFRNMKQGRHAMAVVLDEHGGMAGIVTMNDLLEQLVGSFDEEEPRDDAQIERLDASTWRISGSAPLEEAAKALGVKLESDDYETFGGFVFGVLGTVPEDGRTPAVEAAGLDIQVTQIRDHRMEAALVRRTKEPQCRTKEDEKLTAGA